MYFNKIFLQYIVDLIKEKYIDQVNANTETILDYTYFTVYKEGPIQINSFKNQATTTDTA